MKIFLHKSYYFIALSALFIALMLFGLEKWRKSADYGAVNEIPSEQYELLSEKIKNSVFDKSDKYDIFNYKNGNIFYIYLKGDDLVKSRQTAEKTFITTLGISEYETCQLSVYLSPSINSESGLEPKNYGLSFCPNGLPLESSSTNNQNNTKTANLPNPILTAIVALAIMGGIIILFKFKTK